MKSFILQTPRILSRGRSRRSESNFGDGKTPKIAGKILSFGLAPDSEESVPARADLYCSSSKTSIVEDPMSERTPVAPLLLSCQEEDTETRGSREIAEGSSNRLMEEEESEILEAPAVAVASEKLEVPMASTLEELKVAPMGGRIEEALTEMRCSASVTNVLKRLLDALVGIAMGGGYRARNGRVQGLVGALCLLVGWVAVMDVLALSVVFSGGSGDVQFPFSGLPPT